MTFKLPFKPEQSGYAATHPRQVIQVELDGGAPRTKLDIVGATARARANWVLNQQQYNEFMQFVNVHAQRGALPLLMDLVLDFWAATQYKCWIIPGTIRTSNPRGLSYQVSMEMHVEQYECMHIGLYSFNTDLITRQDAAGIPEFDDVFLAGDKVQLVGAYPTTPAATDLDGIFSVTTPIGADTITLLQPELVNANWDLIVSVTNIVKYVGVAKVPT